MARLGQDDQAGVSVDVDEARADDTASRVDRPAGLEIGDVATEDADGLTLDADSTVESDVAGAVDDQTVLDEQVEHAALRVGFRPQV
jgi:hypothetical protein